MSQVRANSITNAAGTGAPDFPNGIEVSGGNVGIGTASPTYMLDVAADARINGHTIGKGGGNESSNLAFGTGALASNAGGIVNIAIGNSSLSQNTTGGFNIGIGNASLNDSTDGWSNIAIGWSSLSNNTGSSNICIGDGAGQSLTTGSNNTIIGAVYATAGLSDTVIIAAGYQERIRVGPFGEFGLGGANYGTFGQVLTSYGTGSGAVWAEPSPPTTAQVGSATAALAYGAVGTYAFLIVRGGGFSANATYAGSSLIPGGAYVNAIVADNSVGNASGSAVATGAGALAGTWRAMGAVSYLVGSSFTRGTVFLRFF